MAAVDVTAGGRPATRRLRRLFEPRSFLGRLYREKPLGAVGLVVVVALIIMTVFADWLAPQHYAHTERLDQLLPPSLAHPLGTDHLGRDQLSRIIYGARISIFIGFGATGLAITLATVVGTLSAYYGGWFDVIAQRFVDAWMSFPGLVVALAMLSVLGPGQWQLIIVIGLLFGIRNSRVIRSQVLAIKSLPYIEASRAVGVGDVGIMLRHLIPNSMAPIIILATIEVPAVILIEASLSFLGFGVPPPTPSWGAMLGPDARARMLEAPWMALAPGIALSLAVFAWNMFGDALRDLLDPALRSRR